MSKFLIKRSSKITDGGDFSHQLSDGWYAEAQQKKPMFSDILQSQDEIFVAESGYAIFGKGVVAEKILRSFDDLQGFYNYVFRESKTKHERFWFNKLKNISEKYKNGKVWILEFRLMNSETFDIPYLLEKRFLQQNSWYKLDEYFNLNKIEKINTQLHEFIPTKLRKNLFHKYKLQGKEHIIDIDHHVPKVLNGPGNIEENLVPLSVFQNRSKKDSVPSKLFSYAQEFHIKLPEGTIIKPENYYSSSKHKSVAKQITEKINLDFDNARRIYNEIKMFHFPNSL